MITAELWTLAQCNNGGDVSAHDKHAQMCKLQSFMSLGRKCLTECSPAKQQLFTVYTLTVCSWNVLVLLSCMPLLNRATVWWQNWWQDQSSCSHPSRNSLTFWIFFFVQTFLHHSPYFSWRNSMFCSIFLLFSMILWSTFFYAKSHYWNNVFADITVTSLIAMNI